MAAKPFNYGGQAVIEGVMMRGSHMAAIAVRGPKGQIHLHTEPLNPRIYSGPIARTPLLRGLIMLWDALGLGIRSLMFSANVALGEEEAKFEGPIAWGTVAVSLSLGIGLFFLLPAAVGKWLAGPFGLGTLATNLLEGLIRLLLLVGYIWAIGFMPDVRRLFAYHGAEHKTINAYEAGAPLTPDSVARFPLEHPRCGTAFLLTVVVLSILVFSLVGNPALWLRLVSRILLIPVVAGLAYEFIRFTARHIQNPIIRAIVAPNLALQRLTTREPDAAMLEVAIAALERVLESEGINQPSAVSFQLSAQPLPPSPEVS
ncbi:MAG: DUF1385 domain-containing protein [Chloroflexota bacterium]